MEKSSAAIANDEAFAAGREAFEAGKPNWSNPETQNSARSFNWDNGWHCAKRDAAA